MTHAFSARRFLSGGVKPDQIDAAPDMSLLRDAPFAALLTDTLGVIIDCNISANEAFGGSGPIPLRGRRIGALLPAAQDTDSQIYRVMRQAAEDGSAKDLFDLDGADEKQLAVSVSRAGSDRHFLWIVEPSAENDGRNPSNALAVGKDLPIGILSYRRDGTVAEMNDALSKWTGVSADAENPAQLDDIFGDGGQRLLARRDEEAGSEEILSMRVAHGESVRVRVFRNETPDDAIDGNALRQACVVQRSASFSGPQSKDIRRLVRMLDDAPVAVALTDPNGVLMEGNDRLAAMTGGAARVGAEIGLAFGMDDRADVNSRLAAVAKGETFDLPLEVRISGSAGHDNEAHLQVSPVDTDQGELLLLHLIDVSDRKVIERQLAQAQKMQAVGKLAGGIAHDVNNVLTAIRGHADLMMLRHHEGDPDFEHLHQIRTQTERAAEVISQLLAFSRRQTMKREVTDLSEALDEMRHMLNPLVTERVQLTTHHARDLGLVRIDRSEFQRVIMNLCVNGCDAMDSAGELRIETRNIIPSEAAKFGYRGLPAAEFVLISIRDSGTGIPPENLDKIFEPFFTTKETGKGTGLGLSTVYGIIKQMEGYIYCDSQLGEGTTFRIFLPRYKGAPAPAVVAPAPADPARTINPDLSGTARILLVEDEEAVRSFAVRALELRGYKVLSAGTGAEAVEIVREDPYAVDLIVSDVVMPEMTGPEMLRCVREMRDDIRFVFISGYAEDAFREQMHDDDRDFHFLPKPFSLKDLAVKVKETLEGP